MARRPRSGNPTMDPPPPLSSSSHHHHPRYTTAKMGRASKSFTLGRRPDGLRAETLVRPRHSLCTPNAILICFFFLLRRHQVDNPTMDFLSQFCILPPDRLDWYERGRGREHERRADSQAQAQPPPKIRPPTHPRKTWPWPWCRARCRAWGAPPAATGHGPRATGWPCCWRAHSSTLARPWRACSPFAYPLCAHTRGHATTPWVAARRV